MKPVMGLRAAFSTILDRESSQPPKLSEEEKIRQATNRARYALERARRDNSSTMGKATAEARAKLRLAEARLEKLAQGEDRGEESFM